MLSKHSYGHAVNLACSNSIKKSKVMKDALDTTYEITKIVKKSLKRDTQVEKIQKEFASDEGKIPSIRWPNSVDCKSTCPRKHA